MNAKQHDPGAGDEPRPRKRRGRRAPPGAAPGTMVGDPAASPARILAIGWGPDALESRVLADAGELAAFRQQWPRVWINVDGVGDAAVVSRVGEVFGLHRLALADVVHIHQRAKVEEYEGHTFVVLRMVDLAAGRLTEQLSMFLGDAFVVTFQEHAGDNFDAIRKRLEDPGSRVRSLGTGYIGYAVLDAVVDGCFPAMEDLGDRMEQVEQRILAYETDQATMGELYALRQRLLELRRAIWPLRDLTAALARGEAPRFGPAISVYLRDVHDHVVQLIDLVESQREIAASLMEVHLGTVSNRLNEVMKVLTLISTIFIPLTFVTSVYGMNFAFMPELDEPWAYPLVMVAMAAIAGLMLAWFRRKGWF